MPRSSPPPPAFIAFAAFNSRFFSSHVQGPLALLNASPKTVGTNLMLAVILAILFGFFGLLLYDTLEEHEEDIKRWLGPLNRASQSVDTLDVQITGFLNNHHLSAVGDALKIIIALVVFGLVYSFVDPSFSFTNPDAIELLLAITLSIGLVNLLDDIAKLIFVRRLGGAAVVRVHSGNLVVAVLLVLVSRVGDLTPGILSVGPGGFEGEERGDPHRLSLIGAAGYAVPALIAWVLLSFFPKEDTNGTSLWIATVLSLIFAVALQTVCFELIPLKGFYGQAIYQRDRRLWFALFGLFIFLFIQTQLNPDGEFLSAFQKPNMVALAVSVGVFCLFSVATYLYFLRKDAAEDKIASREA